MSRERVSAYFDSPDKAQSAVVKLRAIGADLVAVERIPRGDDTFLPLPAPFPNNNMSGMSPPAIFPGIGAAFVAGNAAGEYAKSAERTEANERLAGRKRDVLLDCTVPSELTPQAIACIQQCGGSFTR